MDEQLCFEAAVWVCRRFSSFTSVLSSVSFIFSSSFDVLAFIVFVPDFSGFLLSSFFGERVHLKHPDTLKVEFFRLQNVASPPPLHVFPDLVLTSHLDVSTSQVVFEDVRNQGTRCPLCPVCPRGISVWVRLPFDTLQPLERARTVNTCARRRYLPADVM